MRHLKVSLLLVERKRCAGEFLLILVSSSNALSLLQSPGAGDDIRFMDDASSNPGKISSCVSAVVYRVSLCAVFISTWLTVIVLLTQATSLDKCSSNFGRRSVCVCVCVCAYALFLQPACFMGQNVSSTGGSDEQGVSLCFHSSTSF